MNRYLMSVAAHDITDAMDKLINLQLERHAWLIRAGEQIRNHREAGCANNAPASNS